MEIDGVDDEGEGKTVVEHGRWQQRRKTERISAQGGESLGGKEEQT